MIHKFSLYNPFFALCILILCCSFVTASDIDFPEGCWFGYLDIDFYGGKCWIGLDIDVRSPKKIGIVYHRISGLEEFQNCKEVNYIDGQLRFKLDSESVFSLSVDLKSKSMSGILKTEDYRFPAYLEFDPAATEVKNKNRFFKEREYSYQAPKEKNDGLLCASLNSVGIDSEKIIVLMNLILDETFKNICSFLLFKDNKLVVEEYFWQRTKGGFPYYWGPEEPQNIYSATRTFTAALVGIAVDQGLIPNLQDKLLYFYPEYKSLLSSDKKEIISLDHLLSMESGFRWEQADIEGYAHLFDQIRSQAGFPILEYLFERPLSTQPGQEYLYNNELSTALGEIVARTAKMSLVDFAEKHLLGPLGISSYSWHVYPDGLASGGNGLRLRPRDMAKLGLLHVNKGIWNGIQILSNEWIDRSFSRHTKIGNVPYGYHWFLNTFFVNGQRVLAPNARGHYGQFIFVFPSLDMVCVMTSAADESHQWDQPVEMIAKYVLPAVLPSAPQSMSNKTIKVEKEVLDDYKGIYQHEKDRFGMLTRKSGHLYYKSPGDKFHRLSGISESTFYSESEDILLTLSKAHNEKNYLYTVVKEGIEEEAIKIEFYKGKEVNQTILVIPREILGLLGLILSFSGLFLFRILQAKQKEMPRLARIWEIITLLAGICIVFLILKDADILEEMLNLGTYKPGWDELIIVWSYVILTIGLILLSFRIWKSRRGTFLDRGLFTVVTVLSICLIVILLRIGLMPFP